MNVSEVMSSDVRIASPDDTLQHAAQMMQEIGAGVLPVGEGDRLVGMLTDRDIAVRAVGEGRIAATCTVREVMSTDIEFVYEDESLEHAARNMGELQVRRLPVLDRAKRLVGILSLGDVALSRKKVAGDAMKDISQPVN